MESGYKRSLKRVCHDCVSQAGLGLFGYSANRDESRAFLSGSIFFRKKVALDAYVYLVISPALGGECGYTVLIGWGFGESLVAHNYLEQLRELGGKIWPTRRFPSGFEQLDVLENKSAAWGEVLPSIRQLQEWHGSVTPEIQDQIVRNSLFSALARAREPLSAYAESITSA